ncbi:MAG: hypothetical protein ACSLFR_10280 [Solirubrobacteraceae bacterium]
MTTRWARFVRGWVTTGFAVFVAAFAHVAGGGHAPDWLAVAVSLAFAGILCVPLAGKTLSLPRLTISVAGAQAVFHTLFALAGGQGHAITTGHHGAVIFTATALAEHGDDGAQSMTLAHVIAAVITIVALRFGESAFWGIVARAKAGMPRLRTHSPVAFAQPASTPAPQRELAPTRLRELAASVSRRGPPALLPA